MACNNRPTLQTYDEDASDGFTSPYTPALSEACYSFVACGYVGGCIDAGPDYTSPLPCNDLTYHSSQTESWTDAFGTTTNYTDYVSCDCTSVASATDTGCGELEMYLSPFCFHSLTFRHGTQLRLPLQSPNLPCPNVLSLSSPKPAAPTAIALQLSKKSAVLRT